MVSLASLSTMIGSWQFLEKDEIKEWKITLPVQGHVRVRVGKRKTSVWGSEIFHLIHFDVVISTRFGFEFSL